MSRYRAVAVGAFCVAAAFTIHARVAAAPSGVGLFELPRPTGRFPVGTASWRVVDPSRSESFAADHLREIDVVAWYPAATSEGSTSPYLRAGPEEARSFATLLRVPDALDGLIDVKTHSIADALPASSTRTGGKLPLLLFSHGYTAVPSAYTALLEDLASHGFAILSIVHPYEATGATLSDGSVVTVLNDAHTLRRGILDVVGEWAQEDEVLASVTRSRDEREQERLLRAYGAGLRNTTIALRRWVDDTKIALDRLSTLPSSTAGGRLAARVDPGRVGAFGHSMGGVTAGQFCVEDTRCAAALNLDGSPQSGTMIDAGLDRPFAMVYSGRPGRLGASDVVYRRASIYYRIDVLGTKHLDFSDMVFWPPLRQRGALGPIEPARAVTVTRAVVRDFFDQMLNRRPSAILAGRSVMPDARVTRFERPR